MSTTVDNRVVEMRFDNKQFESNVQTSLKTLSDLKKGLDLSDSAKGLESISKASSRVSFDGLTSGIETVRARFSGLDVAVATIFQNITNSAWNAGTKIVSALTIDPMKTGFQEYETQINAVQTILANTQATTKQVVKQVSADTQAEIAATLDATIESNASALDNLEKTHKEELRSYEKLADEELEVLEDKHDAEIDALEDSIDEEMKLLKSAHQEKLDLYEEEYMEKLKVIDEERYSKIKAVEDQIDAINRLTESEEEQLKLQEQSKKLAELQSKIDTATSYEDRLKAEEKLAEYKAKIEREQLLAEREAQIEQLELSKENIDAEYDAMEEKLKEEYDAKKAQEEELYDLKVEKLEEESESRKKALTDVHDEEKKLLKEQISLEKEAIKERQDAEIDALNAAHKVAIGNLQERSAATTYVETIEVEPSTLEDVNKALDELNQYADKTIYNFTEMTRNIGTFTAAGIDLDTSVTAIKGIANLAAVSGSSSQQASTAMYQLSQALASGTVKLMDWNSVVNAGMGGQVFQDALKETARVHGVAIDDLIAQNGSFRESLHTGWLTADILTETLEKFTMSAEDMTEAEIEEARAMYKATGYTEEQIDAIFALGKTATDAATKVKTLSQLFDTLKEAAQSGWTQTWEIIVGDFEEAKELLTEVSEVFGGAINASAQARNEMLQGWKDLGGRTALIDSLRNTFEGIVNIITPIKEAFREIFPPMTSEQLYNITVGLKELTERFKNGTADMSDLKSTFKGLFAILDIGKQAIESVWNVIKPLLSGTGDLAKSVLNVTGSFGEWLVNLNDTIRETGAFDTALQKVIAPFKALIDYVKEIANSDGVKEFCSSAIESLQGFIESLKEKFDFPGLETFSEFLTNVKEKMGDVGTSVDDMKSSVVTAVDSMGESIEKSKFAQFFNDLWEGIKKIASGIGKAAGSIGDSLGETFTGDNFGEFMGGISIGAIAVGLVQLVKSIKDMFDELGGVTENLVGILDSVKGCFEAYQNSLKADTLMKIAGAIAILAVAVIALAMVDANKLSSAVLAISTLFAELVLSMKMLGGNTVKIAAVSAGCVALATAIAIMGGTLAVLSTLDQNGVSTGVMAIAGLTALVVASAKIMSSGNGQLVKGATSLIAFSIAIKILGSVCKDLSTLNVDELKKGLTGVGILLAEVAVFLNIAKFSSNAMGTATGILILSAALKVLAGVCEDFGAMSWEEITKGLASIGILLAELAIFTNLTGNAKHVMSTATSLVIIGAAMKIFASVLKDMGALSWEEIGKGLVAMGGALAEIVIAVNLMPKDMVSKGAGLVAIAGAITILASALDTMGGMSWEEIAKGMVAMGGALTILAVALHAMKGTISGSAALLVASAALLALAPALKILGSMSWESIGKGLVALAGAFTVLGIAGAVLGPLVPTIIGLSAAFTLIGVGVLSISAGLMMLATAFTTLATLGSVGAVAVVKALQTIILGVADTIVAIGVKLGEAIIAFGQTIIEGAPVIAEAVITVVQSVITALVESVPLIVEGVVQILTSTITTIAEYAPEIMEGVLSILTTVIKSIAEAMPDILEGVFDILISILEAIAEYTPKIVDAVIDIVVGFLDAIAERLPDVIDSAVDVALAFIQGITEKLPDIIQAGFDLLISFLQGITDAINNNTPTLVETMKGLFLALLDAALEILKGGIDLVWEAGKKIIDSGLIQGIWDKVKAFASKMGEIIAAGVQAIKDKLTEWKDAGKELIDKVIAGIGDKFTAMVDKVKELINNAKEAITGKFTEWKNVGKDLISGFITGIKDKASDLLESAKDVVSGAVDGVKDFLGIKSPSKLFAEIGRYSDEGLIEGLKAYSGKVAGAAENVGGNMLDAMANSVAGISSVIADDDWEPMIRPVLDLSNVQAGVRSIDAMFSRTHAMELGAQMSARESNSHNTSDSVSTPYGNSYQFVQNNYSPKALSRIDIYRQTKNQFSAMERMVNT